MNPFKAFRRWLNRSNKPKDEPLIYNNYVTRPKIIEGDKAKFIECIIEDKPFMVIVQDGAKVYSTVHSLSQEAFSIAIKSMAKDDTFKQVLTDIVIDINTEDK